MIAMELIERLTQHKTLGAVPREELMWLAEHSEFRRFAVGEMISHKGEPVEGMYVILSGRLALLADRGGGPSKIAEWGAGDVTGMLPFPGWGTPRRILLSRNLWKWWSCIEIACGN